MIYSQVLIDADILVYRAGYAAQSYTYTYEDLKADSQQEIKAQVKDFDKTKLTREVIPDETAHALHSTKLMVEDIVAALPSKNYKLFLTSEDKSNYRFEIAKTKIYKGNRTQPKPYHYTAIREYLTEKYKAINVFHKEADDEMGIRACQQPDSVIVSIDKDLDMIPGWHYNFVTKHLYETKDPGELKLSENKRKLTGGGLLWFYAQMLLGDSADNIPGIKGLGPVGVYKLLKDIKIEDVMIKVCYNVYKEKKVEDRFLEVADLLWIQREDWDKKSLHLEEIIK